MLERSIFVELEWVEKIIIKQAEKKKEEQEQIKANIKSTYIIKNIRE